VPVGKGVEPVAAADAPLGEEEAFRQIDEIGVIARVTPEQKVRLVDILKAKGTSSE
jgi:P-type Ca2+ transporter type 2C